MLPLDSGDDITALLRVLDNLSLEAEKTRREVNQICETADLLGGVEQLSQKKLAAEINKQTFSYRATMAVLDTAQHQLEQILALLRSYSRADVVRSLELHKTYSAELEQWRTRTNDAYIEYMELEAKSNAVDRQIAKVVTEFYAEPVSAPAANSREKSL